MTVKISKHAKVKPTEILNEEFMPLKVSPPRYWYKSSLVDAPAKPENIEFCMLTLTPGWTHKNALAAKNLQSTGIGIANSNSKALKTAAGI